MKSRYNGAIDFWKFIFCLVILIYHVGEYFGTGDYPFRWGMYSVEFFFVVSGYFMCISADKKKDCVTTQLGTETFRFIMNKLSKIYPVYLFAFSLSFAKWFLYSGLEQLRLEGLIAFTKSILWMLPDFFMTFMSGYEGKVIIRITWYISAMFIAMLVIYPLLRKYKDSYQMIVAPLVVLFFTGYLANTTHYNGIMQYEIFMTHGVMRAFIGLNLGCLVYTFSKFLARQSFTKLSSVLLAIAEYTGYGLILFLMQYGGADGAYIINICLFFTVAITASRQSVSAPLFNQRFCSVFGKMSLYVYLCQSPARALVKQWNAEFSYRQSFVYIVILSFGFAFLGMLIVHGVTMVWNNKKTAIRGLFMKENDNKRIE